MNMEDTIRNQQGLQLLQRKPFAMSVTEVATSLTTNISASTAWQKRWAASDLFRLVRIDANRLACPKELLEIQASASIQNGIIVIEKNIRKVAATKGGYVPPVVVVGGIKRVLNRKQTHLLVWAGEKAIKALDLKPEDIVSSTDIAGKLQLLASKSKAVEGVRPMVPYIDMINGSCILKIGENFFKQKFALDAVRRSVMLTGKMEACGMPDNIGTDTMTPAPPMPDFKHQVSNAFGGLASIAPLGNRYSKAYGARGSELNTPGMRLMSNVPAAVAMYLDYIKTGNHKPLKSSFAPVPMSMLQACANLKKFAAGKSIAAMDFFDWQHKEMSASPVTKLHAGKRLEASAFKVVGDAADPSTWEMEAGGPGSGRHAGTGAPQNNQQNSGKHGYITSVEPSHEAKQGFAVARSKGFTKGKTNYPGTAQTFYHPTKGNVTIQHKSGSFEHVDTRTGKNLVTKGSNSVQLLRHLNIP